jgi:hypothetical protein
MTSRGLSFVALTWLLAGCASAPPPDDPSASGPTATIEPPAPPAGTASGATDVAEPPSASGEQASGGEAAAAAQDARADGQPCSRAEQCESGICEGACGVDKAKCMPRDRMCTRDLRIYCGCDGKEFRSSGSCPGRPFSRRGRCDGKIGF